MQILGLRPTKELGLSFFGKELDFRQFFGLQFRQLSKAIASLIYQGIGRRQHFSFSVTISFVFSLGSCRLHRFFSFFFVCCLVLSVCLCFYGLLVHGASFCIVSSFNIICFFSEKKESMQIPKKKHNKLTIYIEGTNNGQSQSLRQACHFKAGNIYCKIIVQITFDGTQFHPG